MQRTDLGSKLTGTVMALHGDPKYLTTLTPEEQMDVLDRLVKLERHGREMAWTCNALVHRVKELEKLLHAPSRRTR